MKPIEGYDLVNEAGEFKPLPAMVVGVKITNVVDVPDREYLEIYCDITKGEYAGYFKALTANGGRDQSKSIRSYKTNALPFFKGFITAVEKSNPGYKWDWDESKLINKGVMAVFGQEEYIDNDGNVKIMTRIQEFRSVEAFKEGKIKVPELKKVTDKDWDDWRARHQGSEPMVDNNLPPISDEELPF